MHGQGRCIWAAECTSQHWLNNSGLWPTPHCVLLSAQAPGAPAIGHPWSILMELSLLEACRRAPAGITELKPIWLNCSNEITAYLFLLFSVYLLYFPVHKLFFTSFLKELLFNSIVGINYCITFPRDPLEQ